MPLLEPRGAMPPRASMAAKPLSTVKASTLRESRGCRCLAGACLVSARAGLSGVSVSWRELASGHSRSAAAAFVPQSATASVFSGTRPAYEGCQLRAALSCLPAPPQERGPNALRPCMVNTFYHR